MAAPASLALTAIEEFTNEECSHLDERIGAEIVSNPFRYDQGMNTFRLPSNKKDVSGSSDVKEKKKRTKGLKKRNKGGTPTLQFQIH